MEDPSLILNLSHQIPPECLNMLLINKVLEIFKSLQAYFIMNLCIFVNISIAILIILYSLYFLETEELRVVIGFFFSMTFLY